MNTQTNTNIKENKLLILEIIRFLSAFAVIVWHYNLFFFIEKNPTNILNENLPFYSFLRLFYNFGLEGVILFWGISGFIFFWKYDDLISQNLISAKKFFIYRFSRLYPLHFLTLCLVATSQYFFFLNQNYFFVYQINDFFHFFLQFFFVSNWGFEKGYSFNGPIWSVSVEIVAYLIFFLSLKKFGKSISINVIIIFLCVLLRIFKLSSPITDCLTMFFICGSAAIACKYIQNLYYKKLIYYFFLLLAISIPLIIIKLELYVFSHFLYVFEFFYIPLILTLSAIEFKISDKFRSFIEAIGNTTYSSYLLHFPAQLLISLFCIIFNIEINIYNKLFFIIYILFIFIVSFITYRNFEKPVQSYIRKIFYN